MLQFRLLHRGGWEGKLEGKENKRKYMSSNDYQDVGYTFTQWKGATCTDCHSRANYPSLRRIWATFCVYQEKE